MIVTSVILLVISILTLGKFDKCAVPFGDWNIGFSVLLFLFGLVFVFSDSRKFSEELLKKLLTGTMVLMILVFIWGDFYMAILLTRSAGCIFPLFTILYLMVMLVGTILALVESFTILRSIIE